MLELLSGVLAVLFIAACVAFPIRWLLGRRLH